MVAREERALPHSARRSGALSAAAPAYEGLAVELRQSPKDAFALATLGMGLEYERLSIAYWERVAAQPPTAATES